jgi:hypothetical protein
MNTEVDVATGLVPMLKLAPWVPAGTVTLAGIEVTLLLSESATCAPPNGAGPVRVTVPVAPVPPVTLAGLTLILGSGGTTVSVSVWVTPP